MDEDTLVCSRHFIITTPLGKVMLEPLAMCYEAAFGMLSVFASDLKGGDAVSVGES